MRTTSVSLDIDSKRPRWRRTSAKLLCAAFNSRTTPSHTSRVVVGGAALGATVVGGAVGAESAEAVGGASVRGSVRGSLTVGAAAACLGAGEGVGALRGASRGGTEA